MHTGTQAAALGSNILRSSLLDDETKKYYLQIVGKLLIKDKKLYNTLADALYIEFDFDRNKKLSENIKLPKHVTFIEEWLAANK